MARNPDLSPASATAHLVGVSAKATPLVPPPPLRILQPSELDRLATWDAAAPSAVPMGAYIPRGTWDRTAEARYRLLASTCPKCKAANHPPLDPCPRCGSKTKTAPLGPRGTVHTYTTIGKGAAPGEFEALQQVQGQYTVLVVDFAKEKLRVAGMLAGPAASPPIGSSLVPVFRRLYAQEGAWRYGTKFRLAKPTA